MKNNPESPLKIHVGDCREVLKTLPNNSIQCCVTSPPYFGLRDYCEGKQIGIELTPSEYVEQIVNVFREVKRVLKDNGTIWLNLGDSYNTQPAGNIKASGFSQTRPSRISGNGDQETVKTGRKLVNDLKQKDLIGIPWRVAFALQEDGWYLRQDIIWHKPNPMPESVTDRCCKSHEYIFLLTKSPRYYYDAEAIKEKAEESTINRCQYNRVSAKGKIGYENGGNYVDPKYEADHRKRQIESGTRNKRSVWTVSTKPYSEAHFATFPKALITPCILAGTKPGDIVLDPFAGSGTTGEVALELGRKAELIELNPEYGKLIEKRTNVTLGFGF